MAGHGSRSVLVLLFLGLSACVRGAMGSWELSEHEPEWLGLDRYLPAENSSGEDTGEQEAILLCAWVFQGFAEDDDGRFLQGDGVLSVRDAEGGGYLMQKRLGAGLSSASSGSMELKLYEWVGVEDDSHISSLDTVWDEYSPLWTGACESSYRKLDCGEAVFVRPEF